MTSAMDVVKTASRMFFVVAFAGVLGACAEKIEAEIGECEPGVSEISSAATVTPPGC